MNQTPKQLSDLYLRLLENEIGKFTTKHSGFIPVHQDDDGWTNLSNREVELSKQFWDQPLVNRLDTLGEFWFRLHLICMGSEVE